MNEKLYICDYCGGTVVCGHGSLISRHKWKHMTWEKTKLELFLCEDCAKPRTKELVKSP